MPHDQLTVAQWNYKVSLVVDINALGFLIWMEESNQFQSRKHNAEQKFE